MKKISINMTSTLPNPTIPISKNNPTNKNVKYIVLILLVVCGLTGMAQADGMWATPDGNPNEAPRDGIPLFNQGNAYPDGVFALENQEFLVLWDGEKKAGLGSRVCLQKVDLAGAIKDAYAIPRTIEGNQYAPRGFLTKDKNFIIVAWLGEIKVNANDASGPCNVFFQKFDIANNFDMKWKNGTPICLTRTSHDQNNLALLRDSRDGAYVLWQHKQDLVHPAGTTITTHNYLIHAQHLDDDGGQLWQTGGLICNPGINQQYLPQAVNDAAGSGIYLTWTERNDYKSFDTENKNWPFSSFPSPIAGEKICMQHIEETVTRIPTIEYTIDIGSTANTISAQFSPALMAMQDGAWIVWVNRGFNDLTSKRSDVFNIRKIKNDERNTIPETLFETAEYDNFGDLRNDPARLYPRIISDGADGAVISWSCKPSKDSLNNKYSLNKVFVQHLDGNGILGVLQTASSESTGNQNLPSIILTETQKQNKVQKQVVAIWEDWRRSDCQIYVQKLNLNGERVWRDIGVSIAYQPSVHCYKPYIALDSTADAVVAWYQEWPKIGVYAQSIYRPNAYIIAPIQRVEISYDKSYAMLEMNGDDFWDDQEKVVFAKLVNDKVHKTIVSSHIVLNKKTNLTAYFNLNKTSGGDWQVCLSDTQGLPAISEYPIYIHLDDMLADICYARPNPFLPASGQTCLLYTSVTTIGEYKIEIFNLKGHKLRTLESSGEWDGKDDRGALCESGLYIYQINANNQRRKGSVTLVR